MQNFWKMDEIYDPNRDCQKQNMLRLKRSRYFCDNFQTEKKNKLPLKFHNQEPIL